MVNYVACRAIGDRKKNRISRLQLIGLAGICLLLCGCGALLPTAKGKVRSPWNSFVEAKDTFDRIAANETTRSDLAHLNFEPFSNSNIEILNYLDLENKFMPNASSSKEELPNSVRECLSLQDRCSGYQLFVNNLESQRYGNVFLDLFNFKRKTEKKGWSFKALVVLKDDLVVYKLYGGKPMIQETYYNKNPLGPIQESADLLMSVAVETSVE